MKTNVKEYSQCEMLPLEIKQSGGKLLPHSDLRGGVFLEEAPRSRQRKRDIVLGTWNVRSLYRAGSLSAVTRELAMYKVDLVGVLEVRWDKGGTLGDYNFFYGKGNENHQLGTGFFVHRKITSAVKRVESVSDRVSYVVMRGHWFNIIVVNVHAPSEEKSDESKDSFYEEIEQVFYHFPKYHMKILLRDFNAKVGRENIFKPTIGNESLHQDSNDNGVRLVKFATSKS